MITVGNMKSIKTLSLHQLINKLKRFFSSIFQTKTNSELILINQGRILSYLSAKSDDWNIQKHEFKVFSQWGEDGIIQFLTNKIEIANRTFIEFGVENYSESNTRFLMTKDNWSGFVIDSSSKNVAQINNVYSNWKNDLTAVQAFLTVENVNEVLQQSQYPKDLGILSIDIDGNDYHVLQALNYYKPRILICEYNALFGNERSITTPYLENFAREKAHYSNLYYGASLPALKLLGRKKGYTLIGTNSNGVNAFFVRHDLLPKNYLERDAKSLFTMRKFKESRDLNGKLDNMPIGESIEKIRGLPVLNTLTGELESF